LSLLPPAALLFPYTTLFRSDKLIQLSLYKQLVEARIGKGIPWASGGTSVTVPLLMKNMCPEGINHFRVGELLYFGLNLFTLETRSEEHTSELQSRENLVCRL